MNAQRPPRRPRAALLAATLVWVSGLAGAQEVDPHEVAGVFERCCAECHVPGSENRKATKDWDGARDLAATAADDDLVFLEDPTMGDLWLSLEDGSMPPDDWEGEPMTDGERAVIFAWLQAGAPLPATAGSADGSKQAGAPDPPAPGDDGGAGEEDDDEVILVGGVPLGHFHPLVVHFPLALLPVVVLAELLGLVWRRERMRDVAAFCLLLAAVSSIAATVLGWSLGDVVQIRASKLDPHRWYGVASSGVCIVAWVLSLFRGRGGGLRVAYFVFLLAALVLLGIAGHQGGALVHGDDYLPF